MISLTLAGSNGDRQEASSRGEGSLTTDARSTPGRSGVGPAFDNPSTSRPLPQFQPVPSTSCAVLVQSGSQTASQVAIPSTSSLKPGTSFDVYGSKSEEFRSPNVVVPQTSRPVPFAVPQAPSSLVSRSSATATIFSRPNSSPFPFASMEHAAHSTARSSISLHPDHSLKSEDIAAKQFSHLGTSKSGAMSQIQVTYRPPPSTTVTLPGSKIQSSLFTVDARAVGDSTRLPAVPSTSLSSQLVVARSELPPTSVAVQAPSAISSPLLVNLLQVSSSQIIRVRVRI